MANVFMAPAVTPRKSIFLAGSIDMGAAINWQEAVTRGIEDLPIMIFNPRRDDWDSSWVQSIHNDQFFEQVNWELEHMELADVICYYFDPKGKAPITLMELGLHATSNKKIVVCCPEGYWRKGNIEVLCNRYGLPLYEGIGEFIVAIRNALEM